MTCFLKEKKTQASSFLVFCLIFFSFVFHFRCCLYYECNSFYFQFHLTGLWAIAMATEILHGNKPTKITFDPVVRNCVINLVKIFNDQAIDNHRFNGKEEDIEVNLGGDA